MKTLLAAALANAIVITTALAGGNAERIGRDAAQDFSFKDPRRSAPDDYVSVLCVTCRDVHLVSPGSNELSAGADK